MAKAVKLEERTLQFIDYVENARKNGKFATNEELAALFGRKSKTSISEILNKRSNIQQDQWKKFKALYGIDGGSEKFVPREKPKKGIFNPEAAHRELINYLEDLKNGQTNLWNQGQVVRQEISGVADYLMLKDAEWDQDKLKELKETYYKIVRGVPPASSKTRTLKEDHKSGRG